MHLQQDNVTNYRIQAYSADEVQIEGKSYTSSLVVSATGIIADWQVGYPPQCDEACIDALLSHAPDIVIIGYENPHDAYCKALQKQLAKRQMGVEILSIGAACRTYNVLLSEARHVALGLVLSPK